MKKPAKRSAECGALSVTRYAGLGVAGHGYLGLRSYLTSPQATFRRPLRGLKWRGHYKIFTVT